MARKSEHGPGSVAIPFFLKTLLNTDIKARIAAVAITLIVALGFGLRLAGLNFGLPSKNGAMTTFHPDEPLSFYTIEKWKPEKLYFHPGRAILWGGFHLFPMAAGLKVAQLVGHVKFGGREFFMTHLEETDKLYRVARFIQVACGAAAIFLIYLIARNCFGRYAALPAALFYALSTVSIVNSFSTRPDSMMIFFAMLSLYFSTKIWRSESVKDCIWAGAVLGLATATKYSAAPYGIFPLLAIILPMPGQKWKRTAAYLISIVLFLLIGSPYIILDYNYFIWEFSKNVGLVQHSIAPVISGPGFWLVGSYFMPYAIGWPLTLAGIIGWFWITARFIHSRIAPLGSPSRNNRIPFWWSLSGLAVYLVISYPKSQQVWYTLPIVPLFCIFAGALFADMMRHKLIPVRIAGGLLAALVAAYTGIHAIAHLKLYAQKNVRTLASEWIEANIPKGETIAIARSYFWTPAVLRQYNPPYKVIAGGGNDEIIDQAVLGLKGVEKKAKYLVLSEFEYRTYLSPKFNQGFFPEQERILKNLMEKEYIEVARFDREAEFLGFKFPKKDTDPYDWVIPNPTTLIFKRR